MQNEQLHRLIEQLNLLLLLKNQFLSKYGVFSNL